jgi:hypothetical protein
MNISILEEKFSISTYRLKDEDEAIRAVKTVSIQNLPGQWPEKAAGFSDDAVHI